MAPVSCRHLRLLLTEARDEISAVNKLVLIAGRREHAKGLGQYLKYFHSEEGRSRRAQINDIADRMRSMQGAK